MNLISYLFDAKNETHFNFLSKEKRTNSRSKMVEVGLGVVLSIKTHKYTRALITLRIQYEQFNRDIEQEVRAPKARAFGSNYVFRLNT